MESPFTNRAYLGSASSKSTNQSSDQSLHPRRPRSGSGVIGLLQDETAEVAKQKRREYSIAITNPLSTYQSTYSAFLLPPTYPTQATLQLFPNLVVHIYEVVVLL